MAPALLVAALLLVSSNDTGWVRVKCAPGVNIYVDGQARGVTGENGLVIDKVAVGPHRLTAEKSGFKAVETTVTVHANIATVVSLQPFEPLPDPKTSTPSTDTSAMGTLSIETHPARVVIDAPALGWSRVEKSGEDFSAELAEGVYAITFSAEGKTIEYAAKIERHRELYLVVDFPTMRVFEAHALEPASTPRAGEREACERGERIFATWPTPGFVTIDARPYARVYLGDLELGDTPLANAKLPAGCVELRLVGVATGTEFRQSVWVEPNETIAYRCALEVGSCERPLSR